VALVFAFGIANISSMDPSSLLPCSKEMKRKTLYFTQFYETENAEKLFSLYFG
jgi:hypothetical protein